MKKMEEILLDSFVEIDELRSTVESKQLYIDDLIVASDTVSKKNASEKQQLQKELAYFKKELRDAKTQLEASRNLASKQQEQLDKIESEEGYIDELTEQVTALRVANNNLTAVKVEMDKLNKKLQTEIFNHKIGYENSIKTIKDKDKLIEELKQAINNQVVVIKSYQKDIAKLEGETK